MANGLLKLVYKYEEAKVESEFSEYIEKKYYDGNGTFIKDKPEIIKVFSKPPMLNFDIKYSFSFSNDDRFRDLLGNIHKKNIYLHCECKLDDKFSNFKCDKFIDEPHEHNELDPGVELSDNLVPLNNKSLTGSDAKIVIANCFGNDAIYNIRFIPIREVIDKYGLVIEERYIIAPNCTIKGMMVFATKTMNVIDYDTKKIVTKTFESGTILIDAMYKKKYGEYSVNFTLAHELYHWLRHRQYAVAKILNGEEYNVKKCPRVTYEWWKTEEDRIEKQADNFAANLLLYDSAFLTNALKELYDGGYKEYEDNTALVKKVLTKLSNQYQVSKTVIAIRLVKAGHDYKEFAEYQRDYNSKRNHYYIDIDKLAHLININESLKKLVETGKLIYIKKRLVIWNDKYVKGKDLTEYAKLHPEECCINFTIDYSIKADKLSMVLQKSAYVEKFNFYAAQNSSIEKQVNLLSKYEDEYTKDLDNKKNRCDMFVYFMENRGFKIYHLEDKAHLKEGIVKDLRNDLTYTPSKDTFLKIVVGLNVPPKASERYKKIAEIGFDFDAPENSIYKFLVYLYFYYDINAWNKVLEEHKLQIL